MPCIKVVFLALILNISNQSFSQTISQTEDWLSDKYRIYNFANVATEKRLLEDRKYINSLVFKDSSIIAVEIHYQGGRLYHTEYDLISYASIKGIEIYKSLDYIKPLWIVEIKCKFDGCVTNDFEAAQTDYKSTTYWDILQLKFDESIEKENLPIRIQKAFSNLMKLNNMSISVNIAMKARKKKEAY